MVKMGMDREAKRAAIHGVAKSRTRLSPSAGPLQCLPHEGAVLPRRVASSQTVDQTHVPCVGRWVLIHCIIKEALSTCIRAVHN